jgi:hypothetical protein
MGSAIVVAEDLCRAASSKLLAGRSKPLISSFGITENRLRQSQHESQLEGDIALFRFFADSGGRAS